MNRPPSERFAWIGVIWLLVLFIVGAAHVAMTGKMPGNAEDRTPAASSLVKPVSGVQP